MSFFKKVTNWFFVNNIDTLKTEGISYGSLLQVELYVILMQMRLYINEKSLKISCLKLLILNILLK